MSAHGRLSVAGRSCHMPLRFSMPDSPYFTHEWRNWGIISNMLLSSSPSFMMTLSFLSLVSVSVLIRPMRTVCSARSLKAFLSSFTLIWVWRTAPSTQSHPCSSSLAQGNLCPVLSLEMTGLFFSPTIQHMNPFCWLRPNQQRVLHLWGRTLPCSHQWCRTWDSMTASRGFCLATTWFSGCTSWSLWTLWPSSQGRGSLCLWSATSLWTSMTSLLARRAHAWRCRM